MDDLKLDEIKAHVTTCTVCSAANKRVNDFCELGRLLFFEWAKDHPPVRAAEVEISQEQYDRLVAETRRARRSGENN